MIAFLEAGYWGIRPQPASFVLLHTDECDCPSSEGQILLSNNCCRFSKASFEFRYSIELVGVTKGE
jgi:hypothetical protein